MSHTRSRPVLAHALLAGNSAVTLLIFFFGCLLVAVGPNKIFAQVSDEVAQGSTEAPAPIDEEVEPEGNADNDEAEFDETFDGEFAQIEWDAGDDPLLALMTRYRQVQCALARRVCKLTEDQEKQLLEIDRKFLTKEIALTANAPLENLVKGVANFFGNQKQQRVRARTPEEISPIVRKRIDERISAVLTAEQRESFADEVYLRKEFRAKAMASVFISILDEELFLTDDQRAALHGDLARWLESENLYWQFYFQNKNYLPNFPDKILARHLDIEQMKSIKGIHRYSYPGEQMRLQVIGQNSLNAIER